MTTLIFDCDGVLADTERYGHLPAFNRTFREFGLPVQWSEEEYGRRLLIGGGKERMASLLTPEFVRDAGLPEDRDAQLEQVAKWHKRKTALYTEMVEQGTLPPRPGIARIIANAQDAGWKLGVASTSAEASVNAILTYAVGRERASRFDLVLAGDCVAHKKPAPDIYELAIERLGIDNAAALVIGRRGLGLRARRRASGNLPAPEDAAAPQRAKSTQARPETHPKTGTQTRKPATPTDSRRPPGTKTAKPQQATAGDQATQDRSGPPTKQDSLLLSD